MPFAPLFLNTSLASNRIVLIGGGAIAYAKLLALTGWGAKPHVIARTVRDDVRALVTHAGGTVTVADYVPAHVDGARIVIAATNDPEVNARIHADGHAQGALVNVVDTPELCDFIFPATLERGAVQIAFSTGGHAPVLARWLKRQIENALPWNLDALAAWLYRLRGILKGRDTTFQERRLLQEELLDSPIAHEVLAGNEARAEDLVDEWVTRQHGHLAHSGMAALYLIGAGPGNPDLLTLRATHLLARADVVLYDRLIPKEALSRYARREALRIAVGKSAKHHLKTQAETCALIAEYLRAGKVVARLKGGDPGLFAHAVSEIRVARELGVPWQIVPGITALTGCAAYAGFPLTAREGAPSVRLLALYDEQLASENLWQSLALTPHDTLAFYMTTRTSAFVCEKLIASGFDPATPVLVIEQGTTPYQAEYEATLGTFAARLGSHTFRTPALLIVGSVIRERLSWREPAKEQGDWFE